MNFFDRAKSILGINARNLLFVGRYNDRASKRFADDKIFTKNYLSSRNVGVAKIYAIIKDHKNLHNFNPKSLPNSFVIKPNKGYGGEGILVIKDKYKDKFVDIEDKEYDWKSIYRHLVSILDGKYAISGRGDKAIIEERLETHEYFKNYVDQGLPDIRVIVFNYVPVIAMLRLPTIESKGKANLHLGAVGVGIDIATGKATYAVQDNKFIKKLPNGEKVSSIKLPNWDEILLIASRAQHASQIKFLAVDIVLSTEGIKILELNARAGLSVQIANQLPLKKRLEKVLDLTVPNPDKGVEVSKTLFSSNIPVEQKEEKEEKPIIGLFELVDILNTKYKNVLAKVDPHADKVLVDKTLVDLDNKDSKFDIRLKNKRITLPFEFQNLGGEYKMILAGKYLHDFLIDVNLKYKQIDSSKGGLVEEKIIKNIDKKIFELSRKINVLSLVKPINLDQEKNNFLNSPTFSPRFFYKTPKVDVELLRKELKSLPRNFNHPLGKLFSKKIKELENILDLAGAINSSDLQTISEKIYGKVDKMLYDKAVNYIKDNPVEEDNSKMLSYKQVVKRIEEFLDKNKLGKWKIKTSEGKVSDIAVNKGNTIFLREDIKFTENRLRAVMIHEIATHIFRLENSKFSNYKLFESGTAGYLATEEGLAIYNQKKLGINLGEKDIQPALHVIGIYLADEMSFLDLFHYLKDNYKVNDETAWKTCLKCKRGLIDTSKKIAFTRDLVYFDGYNKIKQYLEHEADGLKKIYIGKVGVGDLPLLDLKQFKVRYLPDYDV